MTGLRTAVYIPAALWQAATDLFPTEGPSALMQRGLRRLIADEQGSADYDALVESVGYEAIFGKPADD